MRPGGTPSTVYRQTMLMRHVEDGEVSRYFLVQVDGEDEAVGRAAVHTSEHDNLDLAWVELAIRPECRRRGYGTLALRESFDVARSVGRTKVGWFGWVGERTEGFAKALGVEPKSIAVHRRQHLLELEPGLAERLYAEAEPHAGDYELLRIAGPTPDDLLPGARAGHGGHQRRAAGRPRDGGRGVHARTGSAPTSRPRSPAASASTGSSPGTAPPASWRDCRSSTVDSEDPRLGNQEDTSVVRSHRGHRLGQLLKADMMRWLAEAEPQLETVDTFNAESNAHMVAVNERLGYRVMGRELQYQDHI